ncbi:DUF1016 N-terminal domain-containing protein, partial [Mucilaginibacter polytrichastri]
MKPAAQQELFLSVQELIEQAKRSIVRNVNSTMVSTYFQIGRMIVEDEQQGKTYAAYGTKTMVGLSQYLTGVFGRGYSVDNLENMRSFFIVYQNYETPSRNSLPGSPNSETVSRNLPEVLKL